MGNNRKISEEYFAKVGAHIISRQIKEGENAKEIIKFFITLGDRLFPSSNFTNVFIHSLFEDIDYLVEEARETAVKEYKELLDKFADIESYELEEQSIV